MNSIEIRRSFEERITQLIKDKGSAKKKVRSLSLFRILIFVIYMIGIVYLANLREFNLSIYLTVLFVMLFSTIVKVHQKAKFVFSQFRYLLQINEEELDRLDGKLHDLPSGAQYTDPNHAYSPDLDLFGSNSLFQLLVRSRLSGTRDIISQWMLTGASENEIIKRQESIDELKSKTDWRQEITALSCQGL